MCKGSGAEIVSVFPSVGRAQGEGWYSTHSEKQEAKTQKTQTPEEENVRDPKTLKGVKTGTPKTTCGKTMRMTAVGENTEATNASARHQGAPGEEKGK